MAPKSAPANYYISFVFMRFVKSFLLAQLDYQCTVTLSYDKMQVMRTIIAWCCLLAVLIEPCLSDMYMHFPSGSNNRLNGGQDNVRNANRLFDSQVGRRYIA